MKLHCFLISWFVITIYCTPLALAQQSSAPHIITLFFKPALKQYCQGGACDLLEHMHIPGYLNRVILNQKLMAKIVSGIYVSHAGLVAHSDSNGQVAFPLIHPDDSFTIAITDSIKPILLFSNTVHHLETIENNPAVFYTFTRTKVEKAPPVWVVKKIDPPAGHKIPDDALVIFSQPEHIIVAEGTFHADEGQNAILPSIYINDSTPLSVNALQFIKINKFFAPIQKAYSYARDRYADVIAN